MATQYSQLSQSDRSRCNLETSKRRCVASTGLPESVFSPFRMTPEKFMDQAQETVTKATESAIDRIVVEEVEFQPLSYVDFKVKINNVEVADKIVADAAPEPVKEGKFCVEIERNGDWVRAVSDTSDRARDLEDIAKKAAMGNPQRKVRVSPSAGGRAVLRFRSKDGVLGSY